MPFTSAGMFRGWIDATGDPKIGIFAEDFTDLLACYTRSS
jgi:hypothetical protein